MGPTCCSLCCAPSLGQLWGVEGEKLNHGLSALASVSLLASSWLPEGLLASSATVGAAGV